MKKIFIVLILAISVPAKADELIPVENSPYNLCKPYGCMYYEWKFRSDPSLRYIASGYEDGIDYSIARVDKNGKLNILVKVNPIVKDKNGKYWWGYPWSTIDIPTQIQSGELYLYAYFEHKVERDGIISVPEWQKAIPVILLDGEYGKWNIEQKKYQFKLYPVPELVEKSRNANKSN